MRPCDVGGDKELVEGGEERSERGGNGDGGRGRGVRSLVVGGRREIRAV